MDLGYRVEYGPVDMPAVEEEKRGGYRLFLWTGFFVLFLALTVRFWPQGREVLRELLIPGDPAVTTAALENLAVELRSGEELYTALEGFCREIVANGAKGAY